MSALRQHRTMGAAGFGGSFAPIVQYEKWEIQKVFPHFPYFRLGQNLSPNLLAPLCGAALISKHQIWGVRNQRERMMRMDIYAVPTRHIAVGENGSQALFGAR